MCVQRWSVASGNHTKGMFARHLKMKDENAVNENGTMLRWNGKQCRERGMAGECLGLAWGPVSVTGWIAVVISGERGRGLVVCTPCSGLGAIPGSGMR